jgi:NADPH:quinone reductase-like Zn-dependent oxidoreductase
MKQWQFGQQLGWEDLELVELPNPTPAPGEVLLRLRAASLN